MALIEVQKSSEVLEKTPKKELANLKKEILENKEVLTKEDAEKFVKQVNSKDWGKDIPEEDLKKIDKILSPFFRKVRENPNDYLVKNEDGNGYSVKEEVYKNWINSLTPEDYDTMKKYEIE